MHRAIYLVLLIPFYAFPQKGFIIETSGGFGSGWWTYNKGVAQDGEPLGWDHTSTRAFTNAGVDFIFKINTFSIGAGGEFSFFHTSSMLASDHSRRNYNKYPVAEKRVLFSKFCLIAEYAAWTGKNFSFSPQVKTGSFTVETIHPEKENFGFRMFFEAGAHNQFRLFRELYLIARPSVCVMTIRSNKNGRQGERHQVFNLNFDIGLRYAIF